MNLFFLRNAIAVAILTLSSLFCLSQTNHESPQTLSINRIAKAEITAGSNHYLQASQMSGYYAAVYQSGSGDDIDTKLVTTTEPPTRSFIWQFVQVVEGEDGEAEFPSEYTGQTNIYRIYNPFTGFYIAKTSTTQQSVDMTLTDVKADAGRYCVTEQTYNGNTYYSMVDIDNSDDQKNALNLATGFKNYALYNGSNLRPNSLINVTDVGSMETLSADLLLQYQDIYAGYHTSSNRSHDFVGDIIESDESTAAYNNLNSDPTSSEYYMALYKIMEADIALPMTSERRIQIKPGHYYHIESPHWGYDQGLLCETYYVKDYNPNTGFQRVHFLDKGSSNEQSYEDKESEETSDVDSDTSDTDNSDNDGATEDSDGSDDTSVSASKARRNTLYEATQTAEVTNYRYIPVPAFWIFENVGTYNNGSEELPLYNIKSVNTGDCMRRAAGATIVDTRPADNAEVGTFTLQYESGYIKRAHSLIISSRYTVNNTDYNYRLATFYDPSYEDYDVRSGNDPESDSEEEAYMSGMNNWRVHEVTDFDLYFPVTNDTYCYRSIYLPFAVEVPSDCKAYSVLDALSYWKVYKGQDVFELAEIAIKDSSYTKQVIPANTPAILVAECGTVQNFKILYDCDVKPIMFDLRGCLAPYALSDDESIYVTDAVNDANGHTKDFDLKIGGKDYSYGTGDSDVYKTLGYKYQLYKNKSATYIVDVNHAWVAAASTEANPKGADVSERKTTGKIDTSIMEREFNEDPIYYDLSGRRVTNPTHGIYVRQDGVKVLFL